jgi:hypothetical protein
MKRILFIVTLGLSGPAMAQAQDNTDGLSLMERGAQMLMEGLRQQMEPALDDLQGLAQDLGPAFRDFATEMGPALRDLMTEVKDWSVYHPPEILENGDIIMRRKTPEDDAAPNDPAPLDPAPLDPDAQIEI